MSEETKNATETTTTITTTTKKTWLNRICAAVVGLVVGVLGTFGITTDQIKTEKAKITTVKEQVTTALEALKAGDVTTATANLQEALTATNEIVADAKTIAEQVKNNDKESVIETAKNEAVKTIVADQAKKVEAAAAAYTENAVKNVEKAAEKAQADATKAVADVQKK